MLKVKIPFSSQAKPQSETPQRGANLNNPVPKFRDQPRGKAHQNPCL